MGTFYLTTPIYYVNARPHLGHACTTIMADAMCRYRRLAGDRVYFLTGTDEHGERIAQVAAKAGKSPQAYADEIAATFRETWQRLGIANDDFIRTTEPRHQKVVQDVLRRLHDAGEIYFGEYGGWYCYGCERFYTEKEIVDGKCPDHQTALTFVKEENYFFKMSKYQAWLIKHLEDNPGFIQPERYRNEVLGFLREPLQDLSISRPRSRLQWGIPLPFDDKYVTYVWFDALLNYYSAVSDPGNRETRGLWEHVEHLIGKDILKPHGVYWPTMLKAAGIPLYRRLNVHGYWSIGGTKMSKSIGNVVEAFQLTDKYGHDAFRYFLLREMSFGLDASFSEEALVDRLNADLANDLGNLVSRVTTLIAASGPVARVTADLEAGDREIAAAAAEARTAVEQAMREFAFQKALAGIWSFIGTVNRYVDANAPWALAKEPAKRPRLERVLATLADSLGFLGVVLDPFLPDAARKIREAIGQNEAPTLAAAVVGRLTSVPRVSRVSGLFPRVDTKVPHPGPLPKGERESSAREARKAGTLGERESRTLSPLGRGQGEEPGPRGKIPITDFQKVELRVAEVLAAEKVAKSGKLLKLTIQVGEETRTLVAGVAEHYEPAGLVGRKVVIVANLEPATLMGVESNGMVLAAEHDGTVSLLTLDKDVPSGAKVK
ncbi:MAG: methionine--tRNA ligase [Candidatus Rokuibacteriota bacterium]